VGAAEVKRRYTALIAKDLGYAVGFKAGLTNPAVQRRFNYDKPIRGRLFAGMILSGPAHVPAPPCCLRNQALRLPSGT
jgi:2-keto-4-pentenoate hydratase